MLQEHKSYRTYLKSVYVDRHSKKKSYSMRALARDLGILPSHLSGIFSGDKGLSLQSAMKIAARLKLDPQETERFCLLVQIEHMKDAEVKDTLIRKINGSTIGGEVRDLNVDLFKTMADWYHMPILEMTELKGLKLTPKTISERLGISTFEAEVALDRLERLELLEKDERGRYRKVVSDYVFTSHVPNKALRQFHKQMIGKGEACIEEQSLDERYVCSETFSFDAAKMQDVRALIEDFRANLNKLLKDQKNPTEVYHLGLQLFNLTNGGSKL